MTDRSGVGLELERAGLEVELTLELVVLRPFLDDDAELEADDVVDDTREGGAAVKVDRRLSRLHVETHV